MVIRRIVGSITIFGLLLLIGVGTIAYYFDDIRSFVMQQIGTVTIYIADTPFSVRVADTPAERAQGLSGTAPLGPREGMLFIFPESDRYGFWMKDMNYPIDILWFDDTLQLVDVAINVRPESYPESFAPDAPARFVVELPAFTADRLQFSEGERLTLPGTIVPQDVTVNLQNN